MIRLTNSATRRKETFTPLTEGDVRMYVCGPTVYDRAHMGNARSAVVFDTLYRLLRQVYGVAAVTYVRNITDVDDKINARAAETGRPIAQITEETGRWYVEDMAALGCLPPDESPRATAHIPPMVEMIGRLIADGHAYEAEGHVLFSVSSYDGYGRLSGRSVEDMIAGARVEVAPYKRDPMDFVLWKPSDDGAPGWGSPWGRGRPGWHIECSAMAAEYLGTTFDIHGGGGDLMFPHHENEIAQSVCAHGGAPMARVWLHNEMLLVDGRKMSKSLGNFFTVRELLEKKFRGPVIRWVLMSAKYSSVLEWSGDKLREASIELEKYATVTRGLSPGQVPPGIVEALSNDLNTPQAVSYIRKFFAEGDYDSLISGLAFLGIKIRPTSEIGRRSVQEVTDQYLEAPLLGAEGFFKNLRNLQTDFYPEYKVVHPDQAILLNVFKAARNAGIADMVESYRNARARKDFDTADRLREEAAQLGFQIIVTPEGERWLRRSPNK
ncbi:cysteine--tRNA ligase [Palleronia rufa]|uniref:cysteine--tRNA ligase n=1 Tax=Palleronia rufa TaxID=1530186 RepID=UPI00056A98C3|nr:cysteine--tRNA ligase [Palleronia rufa]